MAISKALVPVSLVSCFGHVIFCVNFPFESQDHLKRVVKVIHDHFFHFGLEIIVGKLVDGNIKASNTEFLFLSTPKCSDNNILSWQEEIEVDNENYLSADISREQREKKKAEIEYIQYDQS